MNIDVVRDYYGKVLQSSSDLRTDACCTPSDVPEDVKAVLCNVHEEVLAKYYGCGLVVPQALEGTRVLDLGCGSGRDVYALAQLTGPTGEVVGVDMTDEQLAVAERHVEWHRTRFGYQNSNCRFLKGYIEKLGDLGLEAESFDLIVSNCVVNLSEDKGEVLRGAHRLLKNGGEMFFADVYADRRLDQDLRRHPVLVGECLGGALYWNDFVNLAKQCGFTDPRLVAARPLEVTDMELSEKVGAARFVSATYRLFKIDGLDHGCENHGQTAIYLGGIPQAQDVFHLDAHHPFPRGQVVPVCGNTQKMLSNSRFRPFFEPIGDETKHYGLFPGCGTVNPFVALQGRTENGPGLQQTVKPPSCC
jgi:arsenite methyltransferase